MMTLAHALDRIRHVLSSAEQAALIDELQSIIDREKESRAILERDHEIALRTIAEQRQRIDQLEGRTPGKVVDLSLVNGGRPGPEKRR